MFSKKIQEILYSFYYGLPPKARTYVSPVVSVYFFVKKLLSFASAFRLPVYILKGREKWCDNSLTTLFLGDDRGVLFVSDLLFSEEPLKESLGKVSLWGIKSRINSNLHRTDLIFIKIDWLFSRFLPLNGFMIIPEWVRFMLDLSRPLQEVWNMSKNKSLRENLREMKKHNYCYEMTRDQSKFEHFYHQMYLPYAWKRFGKVTVITSPHDMERVFQHGQLLLIKSGNDCIAGSILKIKGDTVTFFSIGIIEGNIEYLKEGVLTALYYFSILWASENGYRWADFGDCRSFFKDGVFCYKKRWGMGIRLSTQVRTVFAMKACNFHQGVQNFLINNPFIFLDQGKLKGLILSDQNHPLTLEEVQFLAKTYSIHGLDCLTVISEQGFTKQAQEFIHTNRGLRLIRTKPDAFFQSSLPIFSTMSGVKKKKDTRFNNAGALPPL